MKLQFIIIFIFIILIKSEYFILREWQNINSCSLETPPLTYTITKYDVCTNITPQRFYKCINNEFNVYSCQGNCTNTGNNCTTKLFTNTKDCLLNTDKYERYTCQDSKFYYLNNISISIALDSKCEHLNPNYYMPSETCIENYFIIQCFKDYLLNTTYSLTGCKGNIVNQNKIQYKNNCIKLNNIYYKVNQCNGIIQTSNSVIISLNIILYIILFILYI
jgi:hypothetical protein